MVSPSLLWIMNIMREWLKKSSKNWGKSCSKKFSINELDCIHRIGKIPVGEAALRVTIWSKHRTEALDAMAWFISQLKKECQYGKMPF